MPGEGETEKEQTEQKPIKETLEEYAHNAKESIVEAGQYLSEKIQIVKESLISGYEVAKEKLDDLAEETEQVKDKVLQEDLEQHQDEEEALERRRNLGDKAIKEDQDKHEDQNRRSGQLKKDLKDKKEISKEDNENLQDKSNQQDKLAKEVPDKPSDELLQVKDKAIEKERQVKQNVKDEDIEVKDRLREKHDELDESGRAQGDESKAVKEQAIQMERAVKGKAIDPGMEVEERVKDKGEDLKERMRQYREKLDEKPEVPEQIPEDVKHKKPTEKRQDKEVKEDQSVVQKKGTEMMEGKAAETVKDKALKEGHDLQDTTVDKCETVTDEVHEQVKKGEQQPQKVKDQQIEPKASTGGELEKDVSQELKDQAEQRAKIIRDEAQQNLDDFNKTHKDKPVIEKDVVKRNEVEAAHNQYGDKPQNEAQKQEQIKLNQEQRRDDLNENIQNQSGPSIERPYLEELGEEQSREGRQILGGERESLGQGVNLDQEKLWAKGNEFIQDSESKDREGHLNEQRRQKGQEASTKAEDKSRQLQDEGENKETNKTQESGSIKVQSAKGTNISDVRPVVDLQTDKSTSKDQPQKVENLNDKDTIQKELIQDIKAKADLLIEVVQDKQKDQDNQDEKIEETEGVQQSEPKPQSGSIYNKQKRINPRKNKKRKNH